MKIALALIIVILGLALFAVIFKIGFDLAVASYFGLPQLTYLQAFGFIIIISILRGIFSQIKVNDEKE